MIAAHAPILIFPLGNQSPLYATVVRVTDRDGEPWVTAVSGDVEINAHPIAICDLSRILKGKPLINLHLTLGHA